MSVYVNDRPAPVHGATGTVCFDKRERSGGGCSLRRHAEIDRLLRHCGGGTRESGANRTEAKVEKLAENDSAVASFPYERCVVSSVSKIRVAKETDAGTVTTIKEDRAADDDQCRMPRLLILHCWCTGDASADATATACFTACRLCFLEAPEHVHRQNVTGGVGGSVASTPWVNTVLRIGHAARSLSAQLRLDALW